MEIVKPKLDIVFKTLFTRNTDLLKCFVAEVLEIPEGDISDLIIEDPNIMPTVVDGKQSTLDLKLKFDDKIVNVEIQLSNKGDFPERSLYYWAGIYSNELDESEEYFLLKRTICINIVDFKLFNDCDNPYSKFMILEENRHTLLTDKFAMLFLELSKIDSQIDKNDHKKLWMQFLKAETKEELDMLNETNVPEIKKAVGFVNEMSKDNEMREIARLREKAIRDEKSAMSYARREGKKEGREEGIEEGIGIGREEGIGIGRKERDNEMIVKMREEGLSEEMIQRLLS